jgi:hypothetical protein
MATKQDLAPFVRGDTWTNTLRFVDAAGDPLPLTGRVFWLTLKLDTDTPDASAEAQVSVTCTDEDPVVGEVALTLTAAMTEQLVPTRYLYDIQMVNGSTVQTLAYGRVAVIGDVTRRR